MYVPQDILDASFPVSVRGYDRGTVDAYAKRVNRVIAELKVRASPQAAVRHALEQAEEKVRGLLDAREAAAARDGRERDPPARRAQRGRTSTVDASGRCVDAKFRGRSQ